MEAIEAGAADHLKSPTCKGSNGQYLDEFHSEAATIIEAERRKKEYGNDLIPYVCRTCGYWHLAAVSKTRICMYCTDSALFQKDLYATQLEAEGMARMIGKEKRIRLYAYKCPHGSGWHLTKGEVGKMRRR